MQPAVLLALFTLPVCALALSYAPPASSGLESSYFMKHEDLSNEMGLFLQKVNITRDYLVGRAWEHGGTSGESGEDCAPVTALQFAVAEWVRETCAALMSKCAKML